VAIGLALVVLGVGLTALTQLRGEDEGPAASGPASTTTVPAATALPQASTTSQAPATTGPPAFEGWGDPARVGARYPGATQGLLTFRGNPSRTWYGEGPVPRNPSILWSFPDASMCTVEDLTGGEGAEGGSATATTGTGPTTTGPPTERLWCGTGWTGQPAVWEQSNGHTYVAFGAYDSAVHWLDGATGDRLLPDLQVGDIIKGSVTRDPNLYPLLYTGARDSVMRVIAMDRPEPEVLWTLHANDVSPRMWNDDWDGSPLILDDWMLVGGENSWFHAVKLNRGYDANGLVTVDPELVWTTPGWDDELLAAIGDREVSIENSVSIHNDVVYFANSGGLVQGWDLGPLRRGEGEPTRTFRFWVGEDVDASVVVDEQGMLYVGVEWEKNRARGREVGQFLKLDPSKPDNPVVWAFHDELVDNRDAGVWATAGLWRDLVIVPFESGHVRAFERATGVVRWELKLAGPTWSSPVVVDDVLIQGDCAGRLHAFELGDGQVAPPELWSVQLGGCIESTPAVWKGRIYVGSRGGYFHAIGDG
jgi:hypothetical protein